MKECLERETSALENELLRCCARVTPCAETIERIQALAAEPLDWDKVVRRSWWHRIRPLTYRHLRDHAPGIVPDATLLELGKHASEMTIRNRRLGKALVDVAGMFEDAKLRALVFKGPTLAEDAYGDITLRECGDLDLLVHRDEFPQVEAMLRAQGFRSWWDDSKSTRQSFACEFERSDAALDVHWHLTPGWLNYRVDFDSLWSHGVPTTEAGDRFRKLAPEDSLSVLSIHGTKHWWERLRWICDVAELVNRGLIRDWNRVETSARSANALRTVRLGLRLARDLLSADVPERVAVQLDTDSHLPHLSQQVRKWLEDADQGDDVRKLKERFFFRMRVCERARDRVPQLVHYLLGRSSKQDD